MIAIIDYDAGNLKSVEKAFTFLGQESLITRDYKKIKEADKVVLPGVGSYGDAMQKIKKYDLGNPIREVIENNVPFLGICLGLQLLFEFSDESIGVEGLGILKGKVTKIPYKERLKIPHMGWNSLKIRANTKLFQNIENNSFVYFVHSYYLQADNEEEVAATTEYGVKIHAAVEKKNLFACQFHPEKSGTVGLQILKNFASLNKEGC